MILLMSVTVSFVTSFSGATTIKEASQQAYAAIPGRSGNQCQQDFCGSAPFENLFRLQSIVSAIAVQKATVVGKAVRILVPVSLTSCLLCCRLSWQNLTRRHHAAAIKTQTNRQNSHHVVSSSVDAFPIHFHTGFSCIISNTNKDEGTGGKSHRDRLNRAKKGIVTLLPKVPNSARMHRAVVLLADAKPHDFRTKRS